jgi:hypothetical protein
MPSQARDNDSVRVSPMDQRGRQISPDVLRAAEVVSARAIKHAERLCVDPAVGANLLEEAAATVSRALKGNASRNCPIRDLESYLFRAFLRRLNKTKKREFLLSDTDVSVISSNKWTASAVDKKVLIDELLIQCDAVTRDMLCRRMNGSSWKEIGEAYRISGHAAESRFGQALKRAKRKLGLS